MKAASDQVAAALPLALPTVRRWWFPAAPGLSLFLVFLFGWFVFFSSEARVSGPIYQTAMSAGGGHPPELPRDLRGLGASPSFVLFFFVSLSVASPYSFVSLIA